MPYIPEKDREKFDKLIVGISLNIKNPGELNYVITKILHKLVQEWGRSYLTYNELIGVLDCVKQEFYRRQVIPYENEKIEQNGDV